MISAGSPYADALASDAEDMGNDKWEYTIVDTVISAYKDTGGQVANWLAHLNALGDEGWEMVSDTILYGKGQNGMQWPVLLFKRRKSAVDATVGAA
jgi:hypothetical protein